MFRQNVSSIIICFFILWDLDCILCKLLFRQNQTHAFEKVFRKYSIHVQYWQLYQEITIQYSPTYKHAKHNQFRTQMFIWEVTGSLLETESGIKWTKGVVPQTQCELMKAAQSWWTFVRQTQQLIHWWLPPLSFNLVLISERSCCCVRVQWESADSSACDWTETEINCRVYRRRRRKWSADWLLQVEEILLIHLLSHF